MFCYKALLFDYNDSGSIFAHLCIRLCSQIFVTFEHKA